MSNRIKQNHCDFNQIIQNLLCCYLTHVTLIYSCFDLFWQNFGKISRRYFPEIITQNRFLGTILANFSPNPSSSNTKLIRLEVTPQQLYLIGFYVFFVFQPRDGSQLIVIDDMIDFYNHIYFDMIKT
jgi:hypothetical protein